MKKVVLNQIGICIGGIARLNLWGGDTGTIPMEKMFLPLDKATKTNILRCVNDNGFGCESITYADIDIYDAYESGFKSYNRTISTDCRHHTKHFLGWKELKKQGINV